MTDGLFDEIPPLPVDRPTASARIRARNACLIISGLHPLQSGGLLKLHPDAPCVTEDDHRGRDPYRCGSCVHRVQLGGHAKRYSKCMHGYAETPIPEAEQRPYGPKLRITMPRVTNGSATDCRAWWPACTDWEPTGGGEG